MQAQHRFPVGADLYGNVDGATHTTAAGRAFALQNHYHRNKSCRELL